MKDIIILLIVLVIIGAAITYIVRQKKNGVKCIGCPSGCNCSGNEKDSDSSCCNCK